MSVLSTGLARYFNAEQLARLQAAHVGIAGAGGLGSNVAFMLVRSGIRRLTLVDRDVVDASNLNRQAYFPEDVGRTKVDALAGHLLRLEPDLLLSIICETLTSENTAERFALCPIVVEALDGAEGKAMLYRALVPQGHFFVCASGLAGWGGPAMRTRSLAPNAVAVGDFITGIGPESPPLAPRVMQAAAMQADAVLAHILGDKK